MVVGYLNDPKKKLASCIKNAEYEKALSYANEILVYNPKDSTSYQIIGKIKSLLGLPNEAIEYFLKAIKLDPNCSMSYNCIAISLSEIGENEKGLSYLVKDLANGSSNPLTFFNMGIIYDNIKNWDKAVLNLHKAIKLKPYFPDACNNLGNLYYKKMEYKLALYYLQKSINQNKKNSIAYHNLGNTQRALGIYQEAINNYNKALEIEPNQIESLNSLGLTYYEISRYKEGIKYFKKILFKDDHNYNAIRNLAIGYVRSGYVKEAIKLFKHSFKNLPNCITSIDNLIQLSAFEKSLDAKLLLKKFSAILSNELYENENNSNIISLIGFGRSGSLFLHSLLDGHNQISTLPGYFFKGWFSEKTWTIFKPNFENKKWRENLAEKICNYFEPQFNANSKKNVIGKPNGESEWLANNLGFTQLGESCSEVLKLDQEEFKKYFINLLKSHEEIDTRICFELIHEAFDKAYRISKQPLKKRKTIFYHLHNPTYFERASFNYHYPESKSLFIVRNPIQMLESWLLTDLSTLPSLIKENPSYKEGYEFIKILNCSTKIVSTLEYFLNPLNSIGKVRGIKLEDLKKNPEITLKKISEWIGIKNDPSLYKSTFMGKKFSRPSVNFNNITGFDTQSIDTPYGRVFGPKDLEIIETLFWPFMNIFEYTKMSKEKFLENIQLIRPHLDKPFQFEVDLYNKLPADKPKLSEISQINDLRKKIINIWEILNETKTYPHIIKPLIYYKL